MNNQEISNIAMFDDIVVEKATGKFGSPIASGLKLALRRKNWFRKCTVGSVYETTQ